MAESLQPAGNVPRLFIWQKHLAQVQQHEQQKQQQIDKTETQQPYSNNESLDDVFSSETVSGATLCESIQTNTLGENLENEVDESATRQGIPVCVALIEEIRRYPCL